MSEVRRQPQPRPKPLGVWGKLFDSTIGNGFRLLWWSFAAIVISILIEWVGMIWFWELDHSRKVLETELGYLSGYNRNLITGVYPHDLGAWFVSGADWLVSVLHLREISTAMAGGVVNGIRQIVAFGVEAVINCIFIFAVRSAICLSAMTGFVLVGLVAFIDGLVERDIRKACGGIESAMLYHRSKRLIGPILFLGFGFYLTAPFTIHPTVMFLPLMVMFAMVLFIAAKTFKKFL